MSITTMSSRKFNQDVSGAKRQALDGPVFITDRGRPAHVLMSISDYQKISGSGKSITQLLEMQEVADIEFDPPTVDSVFKPADLS